jgi:Na+/H+-dicarboxylate symporter
MKIRLSFSQQIFLGLILGALLGIFLGELAAFLDIVADGYIQLLQMTVLPYVTVSLVSGLGSLSFQEAKLLFTKVGSLLLVLWAMAVAILFTMPLVLGHALETTE